MRNLLWFLLGVIGGFVAAHLMNKDPRGHEVLADVDARITEFTDRIGDAYREQEARFSGIVDGVKDAANDAYGAAKSTAADVTDTEEHHDRDRRYRHGARHGRCCEECGDRGRRPSRALQTMLSTLPSRPQTVQ